MNIRERIETIMESKEIKFNGAKCFDFNENNTKVTVYNINYNTFKRTLVGWYIVGLDSFVLA